MSMKRRALLSRLGATALGLALIPFKVFAARPDKAFSEETLAGAFGDMLAGAKPTPSSKIEIKAPDIAENGAVVPIKITTTIAGAESISIVAAKNPFPLTAMFALTPSTGGMVATRIKMGKTSKVYAIVKAGDQYYSASKEVKVTIGGCGG